MFLYLIPLPKVALQTSFQFHPNKNADDPKIIGVLLRFKSTAFRRSVAIGVDGHSV